MSIKHAYIVLLILLPTIILGQGKKDYKAERIQRPPEIDGSLESIWFQAPKGDDFWMHEPYNHRQPRFETNFYVLYDDQAIYFGCFMKDPRPDSIMSELGPRDEFDALNADHISIDILPFNDGLNGNAFKVTPDNLQADEKYSPAGVDENWDAVWESATAITDSGWIAELKIPWSALRFPQKNEQEWGFTIWRHVRRYREWDTWNKMDKNTGNIFAEYGKLSNIHNIDPPLRLSVMPYFSSYANIYKNKTEYSWNGGMDLKYGIDESFTLDMTLIPDFGQVRSDDIVLNLSPYEVQYDEKRQFFTEGTELFSKGDIFYTRRIGGEPRNYSEVKEQADSGEVVINNPDKTRLINATKVSGRSGNGLGIGIFNAMTAQSEATIKSSTGEKESITTQPFSNYSMLVLDQNLPNNSYLSFVNTNVSVFGDGYNANVSGTDFDLKNKKQTYSLSGVGLISTKYSELMIPVIGHHYELDFSKEKGNFIYELEHEVYSNDYDPNDMGYLSRNNYSSSKAELEYRILNPRWIINDWKNSLEINYQRLYKPSRFSDFTISLNSHGTFKNYLSAGIYGKLHPVEQKDYYEARIRYTPFLRPPSWNSGFWFSSDYRKSFALEGGAEYESAKQWLMQRYRLRLEPRFRLNDQLFFTWKSVLEKTHNGRGFVTYDNPDIIFGKRDAQTIINTLTARFMINVKHNIHLRARHYWATVRYKKYYTLTNKGTLLPSTYYKDQNINFNAFNIDLSYNWRFAPGSEMSIVWKNELLNQSQQLDPYYLESLDRVFRNSQLNSFSIKIIYYLDYSTVKNLVHKKDNPTGKAI